MFDSLNAGAPASAQTLSQLCERVALSLDAGIDVRRLWRSEAKRIPGRGGRACADVADAIDAGESLDAALADAGPFFPPLLVELARVGDQTGSTPEVFRRLALHYQRQVASKREFRSAIAWPILQLLGALAVVGIMIAIGGVLDDGAGQPIDFLGLGLVGTSGLITYANALIAAALAIGMAAMALRRRPDWGAAARRLATSLPVIGTAFQKIALARIAWALRLTMNVAMDLRRVVPVVLRAADNSRYTRHTGAIVATIERGEPLSEGFANTGDFPPRFLDALRVAEETGSIVETMDRLSKQYDAEAEDAVALLTRAAAFLVWLAVASLVVSLIFRVFRFYTGAINDALEGL